MVPYRTTFSERKNPQLYTATKESVEKLISSVDFLSLTTDGWTGCKGRQFIGIKTSFITNDYILQTLTLGCMDLSESHTGTHIASQLKDVLKSYNIQFRQVSVITTDRAANMIKAVEEFGANHLPCFAHALNTFVKKVYELPYIESILAKTRELHNHFSRSSIARQELIKFQRENNVGELTMPSS